MLTGPKGEKRPADVIGNAVHVMRVLTGETLPKDDGAFSRAEVAAWPQRRPGESLELNRCKFARLADGAM